MAVDYILSFVCAAKEQMGDGDPGTGTDRILDALKARARANLLAETAAREGKDPAGRTAVYMTIGPSREPVRVEQTYEELRAESDRLLPFEPACAGCPANVLGKPFGCIGVLNYPIPRVAEEWLMNRVQPEGHAGCFLLLAMIRDFSYTGEPIQRFRQGGLFEAKTPVRRSLGSGPSGPVVTSNQILQAILALRDPLDPGHCLCVLCWLGCLSLDGSPATTPEQLRGLASLETPVERRARVSLDIGPDSPDAGIAGMQRLLRALHAAWVNDAPLWVSA
jgi:hypothetical protein